MLSGKMYTDEYIRELQNRTGNDPALLERVVYAWEMKLCAKGKCLRLIKGTVEPPPQGQVIRDMVTKIVGDDNCYVF